MMQCNIEMFDNNLNFVDYAEVIDYKISFDYLSPDKSSISIINNSSQYKVGYFIRLINIGNTKPIFCGIVSGIEDKDNVLTLDVKNILSLLDVMVEFDRTKLKAKSLEQFIKDVIINTYVKNEDEFQNMPIEVVINSMGIFNATLNLKDNIHNLYDIITKSFEKYNLVIQGEIKNNKIIFMISQVCADILTLDINLPIILDKYFKLQSNDNSINKITLINKENEEQKETYYLLNDNSITQDKLDKKRIIPVVFTYEYIQGDFEEQVLQIANERLKKAEYNDLIEIVILKDNMIVNIDTLEIGQRVELLSNGKLIKTIYTGYETMNNSTIKLIFGKLRIDLTKILKLERG